MLGWWGGGLNMSDAPVCPISDPQIRQQLWRKARKIARHTLFAYSIPTGRWFMDFWWVMTFGTPQKETDFLSAQPNHQEAWMWWYKVWLEGFNQAVGRWQNWRVRRDRLIGDRT